MIGLLAVKTNQILYTQLLNKEEETDEAVEKK
jgi:hypothetical protein